MNVSKVFSFGEFCAIASRHESDFSQFGTVVKQGSGEGSTYTFKDNSATVLGVAHLDTVRRESQSTMIRLPKDRAIICPRLDDRLGVYIITKLLPRLGVTCDWLLTTGEEVGQSSAELFDTEKTYNWAFSFDRAGTDVVLYQHDHRALRKVLRKHGFRIGEGSFSDLSSLDIGCSGINFGCGYHEAHSIHSYALLSETFQMVTKFVAFWKRYASQRLPFDPTSRYQTMYSWSRGYNSYNVGGGYHTGYSNGKTTYACYPEYPDYWTGKDARREYLDWYMQEYGSNGDSEKMNGTETVEDLADRAQSEDNGR